MYSAAAVVITPPPQGDWQGRTFPVVMARALAPLGDAVRGNLLASGFAVAAKEMARMEARQTNDVSIFMVE